MNLLFTFLTILPFTSPADTITPFAQKLVATALAEHTTYHRLKEQDPRLCGQIQKYWQVVGKSVTECVTDPWSAVFISYCVKTAGATATEFKFADSHAAFVQAAIRNADRNEGVFQAVPIDSYAPKPGDIIHANRLHKTHDFNYARNNNDYLSHSAIVVKTGKRLFGRYAETVGGNERDTVRKGRVKLHKNGKIKQRKRNPYISIIKTLK